MPTNRGKRSKSHNRKKQINNRKRQTPSANLPAKSSSHELIYDHSRDRISSQLQQGNEHDNKAYVVLVIATSLIAAAVVLQAVIPPHCNTLISQVFQIMPIAVLGFTYLETIIIASIGWSVRKFWGHADPLALYEHYLHKPEQDTKDAITEYSVNAYHKNEKVLKNKAFWIRLAIWAMIRCAMVFVLFLFSQAVLHMTC